MFTGTKDMLQPRFIKGSKVPKRSSAANKDARALQVELDVLRQKEVSYIEKLKTSTSQVAGLQTEFIVMQGKLKEMEKEIEARKVAEEVVERLTLENAALKSSVIIQLLTY
jgi:predicted  nucleic acid-binding Zn-ribbon protein